MAVGSECFQEERRQGLNEMRSEVCSRVLGEERVGVGG